MPGKRGPICGPVVNNGSAPPPPKLKINSQAPQRFYSKLEALESPNTVGLMASHEASIARLNQPTGRQPKNGALPVKLASKESNNQIPPPKQEKDQSVADTLAWVRAKSAERRSKKLLNSLNEKEKENEASNNIIQAHPPRQPRHRGMVASALKSGDIVSDSIARGVALLSDAEAHISLFENYMTNMKDGNDPNDNYSPPPQSQSQNQSQSQSLSQSQNQKSKMFLNEDQAHYNEIPSSADARFRLAEQHCMDASAEAQEKLSKQLEKKKKRAKINSAEKEKMDNDNINNLNKIKKKSNLVFQKLQAVDVNLDLNSGASDRLKSVLDSAISGVAVEPMASNNLNEIVQVEHNHNHIQNRSHAHNSADITFDSYHIPNPKSKSNKPATPSISPITSPRRENSERYGSSKVKLVSGRTKVEPDEEEVRAFNLMQQIKADTRSRAQQNIKNDQRQREIDFEILIREGAEQQKEQEKLAQQVSEPCGVRLPLNQH